MMKIDSLTRTSVIGWSITLALALGSGLFSWTTWRIQQHNDRVRLWRDFVHEFDVDRKAQRVACGKAYLNGRINDRCDPVMEFFETLAELYFDNQLDRKLTKSTFGYYFAGYFKATEALIEQDHARESTVYAGVLALHQEWKDDPLLKSREDLDNFFGDERNL